MDMDEAARRIFRQHAALLVLLIVAGALIAGVLSSARPVTYSASARVVVDATDPKSPVEAQAVADVVRAIVTSPGRVTASLHEVGVSRDPRATAGHVSVASVGTSRIVTISVTDADPRVARDLANSLAKTVVTVRSSVDGNDQAISAADDRVASLSQELAGLNAKLGGAIDDVAKAPSADSLAAATANADSLRGQRDQVASQLASAQDQRAKLVSDNLVQPRPTVLDRAALPTSQTSSSVLQDAALGGLAGLLVGLALATAIETISPTVAGKRSIAEHLGAPLLTRLGGPKLPPPAALRPLARRVALVSDSAGVQTCVFVAVSARRERPWLTELVARVETVGTVSGPPEPSIATVGPPAIPAETSGLDARKNGARPAPRSKSRSTPRSGSTMLAENTKTRRAESTSNVSDRRLRVVAADLNAGLLPSDTDHAGLVLVVDDPSKRAALDDANELVQLVDLPVLGIVVIGRGKRTPGWRRAEQRTPAKTNGAST